VLESRRPGLWRRELGARVFTSIAARPGGVVVWRPLGRSKEKRAGSRRDPGSDSGVAWRRSAHVGRRHGRASSAAGGFAGRPARAHPAGSPRASGFSPMFLFRLVH